MLHLYGARHDCVHADMTVGDFAGQHLGQPVSAGLGGRVGYAVGQHERDPAMDEMLTIAPPPRGVIALTAALQHRATPRRLTA